MADQSTEGHGDLRERIVAEARTWIGTPYRHQASLKGVACDCLGLVRGVWRAIYGAEAEAPPAYSPDWAEGTKEETLLAAATRHMLPLRIADAIYGDLLIFRWGPGMPAKHCAIITEGVLGFRNPGAGQSAAGAFLAGVEPKSAPPVRIVHAYGNAGTVSEVTLAAQWRGRIAGAFAFPAPSPPGAPTILRAPRAAAGSADGGAAIGRAA